MNAEWSIIWICTIATLLFAVGGTGYKYMRRYILPFAMFCLLPQIGGEWYTLLPACALLSGALHLPYGETTDYMIKFIVGITYALPSLIVGYTAWLFIVPCVFIIIFMLSNSDLTKKYFTWKICEAIYGLSIACCYVTAALNQW